MTTKQDNCPLQVIASGHGTVKDYDMSRVTQSIIRSGSVFDSRTDLTVRRVRHFPVATPIPIPFFFFCPITNMRK